MFRGALHSYSFRIALMYVVFFLVSTLILFIFIFFTSTRSLTEQLDETLQADKTAFADRFSQSGLNGLIRLVNSRVQIQGPESAYSLIDQNREIVAGNLAEWPKADFPAGRIEFESGSTDSDAIPAFYRGEVIRLPDGHKLLLSRSMQGLSNAQHKLVNTFVSAAVITLMLGLLGGYMLSRRAIRRISNINRLCRTIVDGNISQRLSVPPHAQDDLDGLSININSMLDKIEGLMAEIVQVSDNIAHDMRTPLSNLRLQLETILGQVEVDGPVTEQLNDSIASTDSIIDTFNALLRISKLQAGKNSIQLAEIDLSVLLEDVIDLYQPLADDKNLSLSLNLAGKCLVTGDRDLLFQAVSNLLDNAIKYTGENNAITVGLEQEHGTITLFVCDTGPGVAESELTQLCRRFYRVDSSRSRPGNGLGLSLVEAIAALHSAALTFTLNSPGGLCVSMAFQKSLRK